MRLSERLQLDNVLTLEKAIVEAHQTETVRQQQPLLREELKARVLLKPQWGQ